MERSKRPAPADGNITIRELIFTVNNVILGYFDDISLDALKKAKSLGEIGADSLDAIEIQILLEQEFGFKDQSNEGICTVQGLQDVYSWVAKNILLSLEKTSVLGKEE